MLRILQPIPLTSNMISHPGEHDNLHHVARFHLARHSDHGSAVKTWVACDKCPLHAKERMQSPNCLLVADRTHELMSALAKMTMVFLDSMCRRTAKQTVSIPDESINDNPTEKSDTH